MREARYFEGAYHDRMIMSVLRDEWRAAGAPQNAAGAEHADAR